ncbi:hypothetical protein EAE99_006162 [Botrytis elliptica]|nr:hypothetical protein EAE99_006162 [Botrytis elliptica]
MARERRRNENSSRMAIATEWQYDSDPSSYGKWSLPSLQYPPSLSSPKLLHINRLRMAITKDPPSTYSHGDKSLLWPALSTRQGR